MSEKNLKLIQRLMNEPYFFAIAICKDGFVRIVYNNGAFTDEEYRRLIFEIAGLIQQYKVETQMPSLRMKKIPLKKRHLGEG